MKKIKDFLRKIRFIFSRKEKFQLVLLLIAIGLTTVMELIGVVAVMPFINVVMDPSTIEKTPILKWFYSLFQFQNINEFIALLGIVIILIYILKNVSVTGLYYFQYAFTFETQKKLSARMLRAYMEQPYSFHLQNNSADLIRNINLDVTMMFQGIISMLGLLAEVAVCAVLGIYLLIQDKSIAIGMSAVLGLIVILFAKKYKNYLTKIGDEDRKYNAKIVQWLQQSFGGIKETKILGREDYFCEQFDYNYYNWAEREKKFRTLQVIPKPFMETVCVTALLGIIVLKLLNGTQSAYFISTISVFAVAVFRLLPSINRITTNYGVVMFNMPAFDSVYKDLKEIESIREQGKKKTVHGKDDVYDGNIVLDNITFGYPNKEDNVLENINFIIEKHKSIALIGPSGAGKTTLADIILGILQPISGRVKVNDVNIDEHPAQWQERLGYIPQTIYLMDDTIRNNILYGQTVIDENRLAKVVEEAQLKSFIDTLDQGIDTVIGENGICLSGGQRQRIGIARALYNDPEILVLDEATSALDNETEEAVMEAINHLSGKKTLIIIAHRLSTTEKCDYVYEVSQKSVVQVK